MSGERPKPLWPEGLSIVRPVGKQKTEALTKGVFTQVAKQPNPAEQQASEQLGKPPPKEEGEAEPTAKTLPESAPQPSDPKREAFERFLSRGPMRPAVFGGHVRPRRQRKDEDSQPKL
jgi:hypothetical protein